MEATLTIDTKTNRSNGRTDKNRRVIYVCRRCERDEYDASEAKRATVLDSEQ